ncbi:MAG: hypothetical protein K8T25_12200, partial [Planctomycetia bacterium]|nr:hypothetical protein [Planctomycetia bacterium]
LTLGGPQGMPLVEEMFLKKKDADYTQTYSAIMAVRFHGQQADIIPRDRAIAALRLMLDRPQLADLVIPDLARWEDWESVDRLVELFKTSTKEWSYVRVPIINFLRACPRPEAKAKLDELAKLDPESFRRAASFFPFGGSAPAPATKPETTKKPDAKTPASKTPTAGKADASKGAQLKAIQWTNSAAPTLAEAPPAAESGTIENAPPKPAKKLVAPRDREELASRYTVGQLRAMVVGVPIVAAAALLGMFWWILHAPRRAAAKSTG